MRYPEQGVRVTWSVGRVMYVNSSNNGPGLLVSWPPVEGAIGYRVYRARLPSPTFYELEADCCPLLPTQRRPCCPVASDATTLQVEGLAAGASYAFRVVALGDSTSSNATIGESEGRLAARAAGPPGLITVAPVAPHGAVVNLTWTPPLDDGGDLVRGYRIWADISSLNATAVVLVDNTSATRPLHRAHESAMSAFVGLPLLPTHRYELYAQALTTLGGGAFGDRVPFHAPSPPQIEYEVRHSYTRTRAPAPPSSPRHLVSCARRLRRFRSVSGGAARWVAARTCATASFCRLEPNGRVCACSSRPRRRRR